MHGVSGPCSYALFFTVTVLKRFFGMTYQHGTPASDQIVPVS